MYSSDYILYKAEKVIKGYDDLAIQAFRVNNIPLMRIYQGRKHGYLCALRNAGLIDDISVELGVVFHVKLEQHEEDMQFN